MNEFLHLDLFSGIGGFSLAFEPEGFRTIAFCEHDEIKRIVLRHWWPGVPILPDVRDTAGITEFCRPFGTIDLITGGVPCQPASALGQQRGTADERWLWPDTIRLVGAIRPRFAVFENPPALLTLEGGGAWNGIVSGLVALGYDCWWDVFPAAAFGAGHLRERVILTIADANCRGRGAGRPGRRDSDSQGQAEQTYPLVAYSAGERRAEAGNGLPVRASGGNDLREQSAALDRCGDVTDIDRQSRPVISGSEGSEGNEGNEGHQSFEHDRPCGEVKDRTTANTNRKKSQRHGLRSEPQHAESQLPHKAVAPDPDSPRLQRHAGNENGRRGGQSEGRPTAPADLRGRVFATEPGEPPWWHETHAGIPVLAHGIPNKLAEAFARCTGDAVVPQVLTPIAKAIKKALTRRL